MIKVIRLPYGVGVVAETPWAAFERQARARRCGDLDKTGKAWGFDSDGLERIRGSRTRSSQPAPTGSRPAMRAAR